MLSEAKANAVNATIINRKENGGQTVALTAGRTLLMLTSEYSVFVAVNSNACRLTVRLS